VFKGARKATADSVGNQQILARVNQK